tara:strand:+ start:670 stop:918 length:249 start_codon:yes stop_codon:yes gene_type:complete
MTNVKIDGKLYDKDTLPQEAQSQLVALHKCDEKIKNWMMDIAIAQTARLVYAAELNLLLEQVAEVDAEEVKVLEVEEIEANR